MARLAFKLSAVDPYSLPEIEIITVGLEQGQMDALLKSAHEVLLRREASGSENPGQSFIKWQGLL